MTSRRGTWDTQEESKADSLNIYLDMKLVNLIDIEMQMISYIIKSKNKIKMINKCDWNCQKLLSISPVNP